MDLAFTPKVNEFRGHISVQLQIAAMRKHDGAQLCSRILHQDGSALWAAADASPERADFVRIWRESGGKLRLGDDADSILAQCPANMQPERYCICLMALLESGLLRSPDGQIFGAESAAIDGKADLEATRILRTLRSLPL